MRVLIACEFSAVVREEFCKRGHDAWSCDLIPSLIPGKHLQCDVLIALREHWDMALLFPSCTALCLSGNGTYGKYCRKHRERLDAQSWTANLWQQACETVGKVGLENPRGVLAAWIGKRTQEIQPWQFGHGETKATCLWLKNLPPLKPTNMVEGRKPRVHHESPGTKNGLTRAQRRSITYQGIAEAMATQWGAL